MPPNPQNLKPFPKGVSGNPKGRPPKRKMQVDDLLEYIDENPAIERSISKAWLKQILSGSYSHFKEYLDRRDGKLANKVEMTETRVDWSALDNEGDTERPSVSATGPKPLPESGQA